jgi:hypothetical protein
MIQAPRPRPPEVRPIATWQVGLIVVAGITAMGIDYVTGLLSSREREALSAAAEREGRSL